MTVNEKEEIRTKKKALKQNLLKDCGDEDVLLDGEFDFDPLRVGLGPDEGGIDQLDLNRKNRNEQIKKGKRKEE